MPTDDDTIKRAREGDADAWRELYRAHAGRLVVWLGARSSGDGAVSAEDLAAEAWLTAAHRIPEFSGTSSDFAGWLFGIARNLEANLRRRSDRRRTDPVQDVDQSAEVDGPEAWLVGRDWVRRMLAALPPRERDVVGCLDVVGLDVATTAKALGISAVAVRVARHRGLRRLRSLADDASDQPSATAASRGSR